MNTATHTTESILRVIPLDLLIDCPFNPRVQTDAAADAELAASIEEKGVRDPIKVRPSGGGEGLQYEVVDGSRRVRAARMAGLAEVPAMVQNMTDAEAIELALITAIQRQALHPLDEAAAFKQLIEVGKIKPPAIAKRIGKNEPEYVYRRLQLLRLCDAAQNAFRAGDLQPTHALVISPLKKPVQVEALDYIVTKQPTVEQLRHWLNKVAGVETDDDGDEDESEDADEDKRSAKPERPAPTVTPKMIDSFALSVGKLKAKDIAASEPLQAALRKLAENTGRVLVAGARVKPKRVHPKDLPDQAEINKRGARRAKRYFAKRKAAPRKK